MRRICHVCGKEYEYPSTDPNNPCGLRRCADCLKKKKIEWKCTCGQVFPNRELADLPKTEGDATFIFGIKIKKHQFIKTWISQLAE